MSGNRIGLAMIVGAVAATVSHLIGGWAGWPVVQGMAWAGMVLVWTERKR